MNRLKAQAWSLSARVVLGTTDCREMAAIAVMPRLSEVSEN
jgi:hypothetical protein